MLEGVLEDLCGDLFTTRHLTKETRVLINSLVIAGKGWSIMSIP